MSKSAYPSVCVVDTHVTRPPVPPRLSQKRQRPGGLQTLLILLVSVALFGLAIEACFIYHLYQPESATSPSHSKLIASQVVASTTKSPSLVVLPSKPLAHLTDGQDVVHENTIMAWSQDADPLLYQMDYQNKCLVIQQEGYYHVYSKVSFFESDLFDHSIHRKSQRYLGASIPLLMSRKTSKRSSEMLSNSYLAGVFHLTEKDCIFVKVSNTANIARHKYYDNVFGAYMI